VQSANVQLLTHLEQLFNDRDLDAYLELLDPDVEWHVSREDPDATVHHGRDEVRAYLIGWIGAVADLRIEIEEAQDLGDRVATTLRFHGHGTGSGVPFDERIGFVFSLRHGRVTKFEDGGRQAAAPDGDGGASQASTK
jgi:ketosteroid isomerase-like protein